MGRLATICHVAYNTVVRLAQRSLRSKSSLERSSLSQPWLTSLAHARPRMERPWCGTLKHTYLSLGLKHWNQKGCTSKAEEALWHDQKKGARLQAWATTFRRKTATNSFLQNCQVDWPWKILRRTNGSYSAYELSRYDKGIKFTTADISQLREYKLSVARAGWCDRCRVGNEKVPTLLIRFQIHCLHWLFIIIVIAQHAQRLTM